MTENLPLCVNTDEEIGGFDGMKIFVSSDDYRSLNCGFALDEGTTCLSRWTLLVLVFKVSYEY